MELLKLAVNGLLDHVLTQAFIHVSAAVGLMVWIKRRARWAFVLTAIAAIVLLAVRG